jgi:endoglucanase
MKAFSHGKTVHSRVNLRGLLCAVALLPALFGSSLMAQTSFIRVNQVGYESNTQSRAYFMSPASAQGTKFKVVDSHGNAAFSGKVGADQGTWVGATPFEVNAIDFTVCEGTYTIQVGSTVSPSFRVGSGNELYSTPLANALSFYQNERDGSNYIPSDLRSAPGHQSDSHAKVYVTPKIDENDILVNDLTPTGATINAEGGWWDAGDYLKFVQTHSYTVALMLIGVRDFPNQMGHGSWTSNFTAEAKFGLEWLSQMWDDSSQTLYYQVGIGTGGCVLKGTGQGGCPAGTQYLYSDHDIWRLPQDDTAANYPGAPFKYIRNRPVFVAGPAGSKISPNLAGRLAAAFAVGYQVYRNSDPAFAAQCLKNAEDIFELAQTNANKNNTLLTVAPYDFYPEVEWRDDLELGATELFNALSSCNNPPAGLPHTNANYYLNKAAYWANAYITGPNDASDSLNLYDVSGLAHFELYRAISAAGNPSGLATSKAALLADMKKELDNAVAQSATDPFGFGFGWAQFDTTTHGTGLAVEAKEYDYLTGSGTYEQYSRRWASNILGANAWGVSLIVGDGSTFPECMQHQVANLVGSLDGSNPVLAGASVEGPNSYDAVQSGGFVTNMRNCPANGVDAYAAFNNYNDSNAAVFVDNVQSYATTEPAIDLTASSFLMFAWRTAGAPAN